MPTDPRADWDTLCRVMGRPELIDDPRYDTPQKRTACLDELEAHIQSWVLDQADAHHVVAALHAAGLPGARVSTLGEALDSEQTIARDMTPEIPDRSGRRVLSVQRLTAGSAASELLREGDLLLSVEGRPVSRFQDVQSAAQQEQVRLRVLRDGEPLDLVIPTEPLDGKGTTRALLWAGALLQPAPLSLARQLGLPRSGVYVSRYWFGSPADRYGLQATHRILEVDGVPTPDLDSFLGVVRGKPDRGSVRLETVDLEGKLSVGTLKLDRVPRDRVGLGSEVVLLDLDSGAEVTYELVFPEAANADAGLVSVASPIGQGLLGKREGVEEKPGQLVGHIVPHAEMRGPGGLRGVDVKARTLPKVAGRIVRHPGPARRNLAAVDESRTAVRRTPPPA